MSELKEKSKIKNQKKETRSGEGKYVNGVMVEFIVRLVYQVLAVIALNVEDDLNFIQRTTWKKKAAC